MTNGFTFAIESHQLPALQAGHFLFTSESVGEGHPGIGALEGSIKSLWHVIDKICDQVSDAVLDACLREDPNSRVACETAAKTGMIMVFGEISSKAHLDFQKIVRNTIAKIGYDSSDKGFDFKTCNVLVAVEQQSPDITQSITNVTGCPEDTGAGDQGIMFGYATDETPELMPLTLILSHKLVFQLAKLRKSGELPWLRPDCKSQVTVEYRRDGGATVPVRVHTVVLSTQHSEAITTSEMRELILEKVIKTVIPHQYLDEDTIFHIQPSGKFLIGGPQGDAGLTGRKIIVDTYGGWGAHGGGAFSGKDWTKVDRTAAYAARWIAKSIVTAGLARRCLIQLSYSIGLVAPLSIFVDTYGTSKMNEADLVGLINKNFDLRPGALARSLGLFDPIFEQTACYGHFGRPEFPWEQPKTLVP